MDAMIYEYQLGIKMMYAVFYRLDKNIQWESYYNGEDKEAALSAYNELLKNPSKLIYRTD